jgi:molybdopterin-guanine dinucleotide biosynthesis protein A
MPFVSAVAIEKLAKFALANQEADAFVPIQADRNIQPLCGIYRQTRCLPQLEKYLERGHSPAVRTFLKSINTELIEEDFLANDQDIFRNINSFSEYREL